mmetsp:Transcript_2661/g.5501  ORF Transcript_2661/g.5501 Transcript_2661/m.5501 type:complete len:116 (-) Transcript_2661:537-884(-)
MLSPHKLCTSLRTSITQRPLCEWQQPHGASFQIAAPPDRPVVTSVVLDGDVQHKHQTDEAEAGPLDPRGPMHDARPMQEGIPPGGLASSLEEGDVVVSQRLGALGIGTAPSEGLF